MSDDYQQHLAEVHARLETPDEIVLGALRELTRAEVRARRRIVEGEANEVYAFGFADGLEVIVRISRDPAKHFEQERWAIGECARLGVPVPTVLLIRHLSSDDGPLDLCVQQTLPGTLLSNSLALPRETLRSLTMQAGEFLSRIHSIPTHGLGYLDGDGRGAFATFEALTEDFLAQEDDYLALAGRIGWPPATMRRLFAFIDRALRGAAPVRTSLTHNDFFPKHILVEDGQVTGIIDFGEVSGEPPVNEFVKWDYLHGESFPIAWLKEGYGDKSLFDSFEALFPPLRVMCGLSMLWWYDHRGWAQGVADAKRRLEEDLTRTVA
ncbi:MAG: phosphotransferase family protein [Caulobacterales bacterium]